MYKPSTRFQFGLAAIGLAAVLAAQVQFAAAAPAGPYRSAVLGLNPTYYYELDQNTTVGGTPDTMGNAKANGTFVSNTPYNTFPSGTGPWIGTTGPGTTGIAFNAAGGGFGGWPVFANNTFMPLPGIGAGNLAHEANNGINAPTGYGHINLGAGTDYAANTMTVAMWYKGGVTDGGNRIFSNNVANVTGFQIIQANGARRLGVTVEGDGGAGDTRFSAPINSDNNGGWNFVVASVSGATAAERFASAKLWFNGVPLELGRPGQDLGGFAGFATDGIARLGGREPVANHSSSHSGSQDELAIWLGTQLSDAQVQSLWASARGPKQDDWNGDGGVDAADVGLFTANWGAGNADGIVRGIGDSTGNPASGPDGNVDAADAGSLIANWTGDPGPAGAGQAIAEYNKLTGEIIVSVNGVNNWYLESQSGGFGPPGSAPLNLPKAGGLVTDNNTRVGESTLLSLMTYTDVNLGNVAKPNLTDLKIFFNTGLGQPLQQGTINVVPEPTTFAMLGTGLAILGGVALKRRGVRPGRKHLLAALVLVAALGMSSQAFALSQNAGAVTGGTIGWTTLLTGNQILNAGTHLEAIDYARNGDGGPDTLVVNGISFKAGPGAPTSTLVAGTPGTVSGADQVPSTPTNRYGVWNANYQVLKINGVDPGNPGAPNSKINRNACETGSNGAVNTSIDPLTEANLFILMDSVAGLGTNYGWNRISGNGGGVTTWTFPAAAQIPGNSYRLQMGFSGNLGEARASWVEADGALSYSFVDSVAEDFRVGKGQRATAADYEATLLSFNWTSDGDDQSFSFFTGPTQDGVAFLLLSDLGPAAALTSAVPEPSSFALAAMALAGGVFVVRRKRRRA
jgi:hypothetical protein